MQWKAGTLQHQAQDAHATECQRRKLIEARSIKANRKAKQAPYCEGSTQLQAWLPHWLPHVALVGTRRKAAAMVAPRRPLTNETAHIL